MENSRRATLVAENWVSKAHQAAISTAKAQEAELAAQAAALARERETQDAAEQATITAQRSLKEAVEALADRNTQLASVRHDLDQERRARAAYDRAAAKATPPLEAPVEREEEPECDEDGESRDGDEDDAGACSDPDADDGQLEACKLDGSVLAEQLAAVEDGALRLYRLEHGLDESGDVGLGEIDTSSPLRALAGLGAKRQVSRAEISSALLPG